MNVKRFGKRNTASTHCHLFVFVLLQLAWPRALSKSNCTQSCQLLRSYALNCVNSRSLSASASDNACSGAVAALSYFFLWLCICKAKTKNKTQKKFCAVWAKRRHAGLVGRGRGKGCARDAVKAFLRGTWESKQLLVSLCRPVVEFAFFSLSAYVCLCVCGCVSLSEPFIHNNNDDATTA